MSDAKKDHERMCQAFDEWISDDATHWISTQDAAFQGFMAAWEECTDDRLMAWRDYRWRSNHLYAECQRLGKEIERLRATPPIGTRYRDQSGEVVAVVVPAEATADIIDELTISKIHPATAKWRSALATLPEPK